MFGFFTSVSSQVEVSIALQRARCYDILRRGGRGCSTAAREINRQLEAMYRAITEGFQEIDFSVLQSLQMQIQYK